MKSSVILMGAASLVLLMAPRGDGCGGEQGGSSGSGGTTETGTCPEGGASTGGATAGGGTPSQGGSATGGSAIGGTGGTGATGGSSSAAGSLVILDVASGGPGCPGPAKVQASYDEDGGTLTLSFPSLELEHHPGSGYAHTSCVTGLTIRGTPGWQFAATGSAAHGVADLPAGASARVKTKVFFAGAPASGEVSSSFGGPVHGPIDSDDDFPPASVLRAPCGQDVIYNIQVALTLDTGDQDSAAVGISSVTLPIVWGGC